MAEIINLGDVKLSETVVVSDPSYDRTVWCMKGDVPIAPGKYRAYAVITDEGEMGERVANLICLNRAKIRTLETAMKIKWATIGEIGVDSGQAGIFDNSVYPEGKDTGEYGNPDTFYGECCEITLGDDMCGRLKSKKGIVSSSGFGDGSYNLKALYDKNKACIALMIDFDLVGKRHIMEALLSGQQQKPLAENQM